jgi:hypothetical protein
VIVKDSKKILHICLNKISATLQFLRAYIALGLLELIFATCNLVVETHACSAKGFLKLTLITELYKVATPSYVLQLFSLPQA